MDISCESYYYIEKLHFHPLYISNAIISCYISRNNYFNTYNICSCNALIFSLHNHCHEKRKLVLIKPLKCRGCYFDIL